MMTPPLTESQSVHPLVRIAPVVSVAHIGDPLQALNARAASFLRDKEYPALVTARLDETTFLVKVEQSFYKMNLGHHASVGQGLMLQYLHADPIPTFALVSQSGHSSKAGGISAQVSVLAQQIDDAIRQAGVAGTQARYEAAQVVSLSPAIVQVMAGDLKKALERTGLFYESHLQEYHAGRRPLSEIRMEPQNQQQYASVSNALLPQQLAILEHQRISWHGEIWPGQEMDWDIRLDNYRESGGRSSEPSEQSAISTDLTLHLPRLGTVKAGIRLQDGHLSITLNADEASTRTMMKTESPSLSGAVTRHGQWLDALMVSDHA